MTIINWGLLGPDKLESERRTRTLGLAVAVRAFNDLAVPNLGGVKFSKNVFLACLGIHVAEKVRLEGKQVSNIQVANAIEALGCILSFEKNNWQSDERLRGNSKLAGAKDLSYKVVGANNYYVTQPMRMATVQLLPGLGLVESQGERFNSYSLNDNGLKLVIAGCADFKCHNSSIVNFLVKWVLGNHRSPRVSGLIKALAPIYSLAADAKAILKDRLVSGNDESALRRRNALTWVSNINTNPCINWRKPSELTDLHFKDIKSGAYFFILRDSVMLLLDAIETAVANEKSGSLDLRKGIPLDLQKALTRVKSAATGFVNLSHDPTPDKLALSFARECLQSQDELIILSVVERDNLVLKVRDRAVIKGSAFGGVQQEEANEAGETESLFPKGVSFRFWNLYLLNIDFNVQPNMWLNKKEKADE